MNRLYNLDYLRGLAASGIMVYHYLSWTFGDFKSDTFLGRLGIYGVSLFYVLSGLTLFHVYYNKMKPSKPEVISFFRKRFYRIFPLLWLATFAAILISEKSPDWFDVFLNVTGLFGFVKWDTYFSPGIWSIGNELVFYVFFPFFVLFSRSNKYLMVLLIAIITGLYIYFAYFIIDANSTLSKQWYYYVHPINQVFLFLGGFLTGLIFGKLKLSNYLSLLILVAGLGLFVFYPVSGDPVQLVSGTNRLIFTAACFLISIAFYKSTFTLPRFLHSPLSLLGEASYSVYLLHPIVFKIAEMYFFIPGKDKAFSYYILLIIVSLSATLIFSYLIYNYFEKYFMKMGKTVSNTQKAPEF